MKNATKYQKKIKKFLSGMGKAAAPPPAPEADEIRVMVDAIVSADAPKLSAKAMEALDAEFVDFNELRVAPLKDVVDTLGRDFPDARRKAEEISTVLNALFNRRNYVTLDHVDKMSKRELRRHLAELGLSPYAAGIMMLEVFAGHAVPVDHSLALCLEADGYVEPGSSIEEIQAFLERIILQKHARAAHEFFRAYIVKNARMLTRKRKAEAEKAAAKAAAAEAKAEAEARAELQAAAAPAPKARKPAKAPKKPKAAEPAKKPKAIKKPKAAKKVKAAKKPPAKRAGKAAGRSRAKAPAKATAKSRPAAKTKKKSAKAKAKTSRKAKK